MLILSLKAGEGVVVDNDVTIRVASIRPDCVRIGIEAPSWKMGVECEDNDAERETRPTPVEEPTSGWEPGAPFG